MPEFTRLTPRMSRDKIESLSMDGFVIDQMYEICFCNTETADIIEEQLAPRYNGIYKFKNIVHTALNYITLAPDIYDGLNKNIVQVTYAIFENMNENTEDPKYIYIAKPLEPVLDKEGFYFKTVSFSCWKTIDFDCKIFLEDPMNPVNLQWNNTQKKYEACPISQEEYVFSQIADAENYIGCVVIPYNKEHDDMANNDIDVGGTYEDCIICYMPLDTVHGPEKSNYCKTTNLNDVIQVCDLEKPKHYLHRGCAIAVYNRLTCQTRGKCPYCVNRDLVNDIENVAKIYRKCLSY